MGFSSSLKVGNSKSLFEELRELMDVKHWRVNVSLRVWEMLPITAIIHSSLFGLQYITARCPRLYEYRDMIQLLFSELLYFRRVSLCQLNTL